MSEPEYAEGRGDESVIGDGRGLRFNGVGSKPIGIGEGGVGFTKDIMVPRNNEPAIFGPSIREPQKTIEINTRRGNTDTALPLTLKVGTAANKVQIVSGYVNGIIPTLGGTALDNATPPEITVSADVWVYVKVVGTFASPDTYVVTIHQESTISAPTESVSGTGFTSYYLIGNVDFTSGSPDTFDTYNMHSGGNLGVESFGAINLWWKI